MTSVSCSVVCFLVMEKGGRMTGEDRCKLAPPLVRSGVMVEGICKGGGG